MQKVSELILLFVVVPVLLVVEIPIPVKVALVAGGFVYCIWVLLKEQGLSILKKVSFPIKDNWKDILLKFSFIITATTIFMLIEDPQHLFAVIKQKPLLWMGVSIGYSLFSVYPQELMYRTFFFHRYRDLVGNKYLFIFLNAALFSLAHLMFKNKLVILITFLGGILFAFSYNKSKSLLLVTLEHAIYGSWLFTVGMGEMLAFPMPE